MTPGCPDRAALDRPGDLDVTAMPGAFWPFERHEDTALLLRKREAMVFTYARNVQVDD